MQKPQRRLEVVYGHLNNGSSFCNTSSVAKPTLTINPTTCLVDEKIQICVRGLAAGQVITLISRVQEGSNKFEARGVYRANSDGAVDNKHDPSLAGTFTGVEHMGLFWSLRPSPGQDQYLRLIKKDVSTPLVFTICVYDGSHAGDTEVHQPPLSTAVVHRLYKSPSVRRIPVTEGPYRGTIFIPEGPGPFPGLVDAYGALVRLVESRAALLASHGYATFALSYMYVAHLPKVASDVDPNYFKAAAEWFSQQDYVDGEHLGAVGLCHGGFMILNCAAICSKLKVVVNINGLPFVPANVAKMIKTDRVEKDYKPVWMNPELVLVTDEGIIINEITNCDDPVPIPAWQHGAKILTIVGEDDKQVKSEWHTFVYNNCPEQYRCNVEMARYPGAGHLIEPPYSPLCRVMNPGRTRMATVGFGHEEYRDLPLMAGGFVEQHAYAQEDSWGKILDFLQKNLKSP